jgi:hypothetical protein
MTMGRPLKSSKQPLLESEHQVLVEWDGEVSTLVVAIVPPYLTITN